MTDTHDRSRYPSLTAPQVADRLGCSEATLWRMLRDGNAPPSYRIGGRRLWRESNVLAWLDTHCREEPAAAAR